MAASLKFVLATWLINVTLDANVIFLANDVSLNPGPGSAPPASMKGLQIYHLNIHSLCNKLDELPLFCSEYKPTFFLGMQHGLMRISQMMNYTLLATIVLEETEILSEAAWQYILMSIYSLTT